MGLALPADPAQTPRAASLTDGGERSQVAGERRRRAAPLALDTPTPASAQFKRPHTGCGPGAGPNFDPHLTQRPTDRSERSAFPQVSGLRGTRAMDVRYPLFQIPVGGIWREGLASVSAGQRPFSFWWQVQDSNLRRNTPTDLQSAPIGRSGNLPGLSSDPAWPGNNEAKQ